jgi:hypothetical protein
MTRQLPVIRNDQTISSNSQSQDGDWELLKVVWSLGVTGSYLVIASYWKLSGHGELLEVVSVTPIDQTTSSNSH